MLGYDKYDGLMIEFLFFLELDEVVVSLMISLSYMFSKCSSSA